MRKVCLLACLSVLAGCNGSVEGDVFIIKGGGDIAVSPGRTVYFVPGENEKTLFAEAAVQAAKDALATIESQVAKLCPVALPEANAALDKLVKTESTITAAGTVPPEGCGELERKRDELEAQAASVRSAQADEQARLRKALATAKQERQTAIANKARALKRAQESKVLFRVDPPAGYTRSKITISNNSDYCVGGETTYAFQDFEIDLTVYASDGKTILWSDQIDLDERKDEFGFSLGACRVPKGVSVSEEVYQDGALDSPQLRKAAADGAIETYLGTASYSRQTVARYGSWKVTSEYDFYTVERTEKGTSVSYKVTKVDWSKEALKSQSFASYDQKIKSAERALDAALKAHAADTSVGAANKASGALASCVTDSATLASIIPVIDKARSASVQVADCSASTNQVAAGLSEMNDLLELGLEIPDVKNPYRESFVTNVLLALTGDGVVKADTNIQGHYVIEEIPAGEYLVIGEYSDNFVQGFWLDAVSVESGAQTIDLNQNTFVGVPLTSYIREASYACESCVTGMEPIPSRSVLVERIEKREAALEELKESFEELNRALRNL
jgi:hypothetical protein